MVSYSWSSHCIVTPVYKRVLKNQLSLILPGQFENIIRKSHTVDKLGGEVTMEELLNQSSFIIDTRPDPRQKSKCYRHTLALMVELHEEHDLELPLTMDADVRQRDIFRHMQYFPLNAHTVLVKDVRYCKEASFLVEGREEDLIWEIRKRWKIKDILYQETESVIVPSGKISPWSHGRIIGLAGILNPVTADQFTEAVKVIDLMVKTSFRLGELKEAIGLYRSGQEQGKRLSRFLVKMIYYSSHSGQRLQLIEYLSKLPLPVLEKFLNGTIGFSDLARTLLWRPSLPLRALQSRMTNKSTKLSDLTAEQM